MYRFLDMSLLICLSVSLLFVGVENTSELPPPKNLNYAWETPFTISLTWEKPDNVEGCNVNYTINVIASQNCSDNESDNIPRRVPQNHRKLNVSNENGLCIKVSTNPMENCGNRHESQPETIIIPAPTVKLVKKINCTYSKRTMICTWEPVVEVKDLKLYYWFPNDSNQSIMQCIPDKTKINECVINNLPPLGPSNEMFYLFNATYQGMRVDNTLKGGSPKENVHLKKPTLTIERIGQKLRFQANAIDADEFHKDCYKYKYKYTQCNETIEKEVENSVYELDYNPSCKYTAQVKVVFQKTCGSGGSDPSDTEEYGQDNDPNLPSLLALIIIPLVVSSCLIVSLVLVRRNRELILPNVPDPSLLFKDMLNNNIRMSEDARESINRLYVPIEEIVESRISVEDISNHQKCASQADII